MSPHNSVSRFVDYFVICGYDHTKGRPGGRESCSQVHTKHPRPFLDIIRDIDVDFYLQIVQRFPERDWPDIPFVHGLDRFCQVENFTCSPFHECLGYLEDLKKLTVESLDEEGYMLSRDLGDFAGVTTLICPIHIALMPLT